MDQLPETAMLVRRPSHALPLASIHAGYSPVEFGESTVFAGKSVDISYTV